MLIQLGAGGGCSPFHLLILFGLLEPWGLPESEEVAHCRDTQARYLGTVYSCNTFVFPSRNQGWVISGEVVPHAGTV